MAVPRKCSECDNLLPPGSKAKTCSQSCRQKRSRRKSRQRVTAGHANAAKAKVPQEWKDVLEDVGHEVAKEELRPVVREAMTEDSMQALQKMVGLLPGVVEQLQADVTDPDPVVRQKAHAMVLRYTLGHEKALPPDEKQPAGVNVIFTMPRPGDHPDTMPELSDTVPADAEELRECDTCRQAKPASEFFGAALRCNPCVEAFQVRANALLDRPRVQTAGEEDA